MENNGDVSRNGSNKEEKSSNGDRLMPRGMKRKRSLRESERSESKRVKDGSEEMMILRSIVPVLRDQPGEERISQFDIIQETINYIDQLHKRVAQRMVNQTQVDTDPFLSYSSLKSKLCTGFCTHEELPANDLFD